MPKKKPIQDFDLLREIFKDFRAVKVEVYPAPPESTATGMMVETQPTPVGTFILSNRRGHLVIMALGRHPETGELDMLDLQAVVPLDTLNKALGLGLLSTEEMARQTGPVVRTYYDGEQWCVSGMVHAFGAWQNLTTRNIDLKAALALFSDYLDPMPWYDPEDESKIPELLASRDEGAAGGEPPLGVITLDGAAGDADVERLREEFRKDVGAPAEVKPQRRHRRGIVDNGPFTEGEVDSNPNMQRVGDRAILVRPIKMKAGWAGKEPFIGPDGREYTPDEEGNIGDSYMCFGFIRDPDDDLFWEETRPASREDGERFLRGEGYEELTS